MDISCDDVLAFGTTTRHLALYGDHGLGDLITSFKLPSQGTDLASTGDGITQVNFSSCGTYLFVAERQSDTIELFDVRRGGLRLGFLSGRQANVKFKLSFDIVSTVHGLEVWAGGSDGKLRMWSNPEQQEGEITYSENWQVHDGMIMTLL